MTEPDPRAAAFRDAVVEQLRAGRPARLRASGQSMWPTVRDGDEVLIAPLSPASPLAVGDVVLFVSPRGLVLHRIIALAHDHIATKGDAEPRPDLRVPRTAILGRLARRPGDPVRAALSARLGPFGARLIRRARQLEALLFRRAAG